MPRFIVKADRGQDWYCVWSTVTDAPLWWGPKADLQRVSTEFADERFARADANGTSMNDPDLAADEQWFGWDDATFVVTNVPKGFRSLPRRNLRSFCEALGRGDMDALVALTEPVDDDPDDVEPA